jgi:hypothetical protein
VLKLKRFWVMAKGPGRPPLPDDSLR